MLVNETSFLLDGKNYYENELPDLTGGRVTSIQFADHMIKTMEIELQALNMLRNETLFALQKHINKEQNE